MKCWARFGWMWQILDLKKLKDFLQTSSKNANDPILFKCI